MLLEAKITGRLRTSFTSVIVFTNNGAFNEQKTRKVECSHTQKKQKISKDFITYGITRGVHP